MKCVIDFFRNSLLVQSISSRPITNIEDWCEKAAKITTVDRMLVGAIVECMTKDFEAWDYKSYNKTHGWREPESDAILWNRKLGIKFTFGHDSKREMYASETSWTANPTVNPKINDIPIKSVDARFIWNSYEKLKASLEAVKAAERQALEDMKNNEKKWNLVEKLLNMKRNEFGALVPIQQIEDSGIVMIDKNTADATQKYHKDIYPYNN